MQHFILPDYLDGTKINKENIHLFNLYLCSQLTDYMKCLSEVQVEIVFDKDENPIVEGFPIANLLPLIRHDESMKVFLRALKGYKENPSKNYIFTKELTNSLKETKLDIKTKYLPDNFSGFIEMKGLLDHEGEEIKGFFIDIQNNDKKFIYMGFISYNRDNRNYNISHLNIPLENNDKSIRELIGEYQYVCRGINKKAVDKVLGGDTLNQDLIFDEKKQRGEYYDHFHAIFNALVYIANPQENMDEDINIFRGKAKKIATQKKIYTPKKFILLGKNFKMPKEYRCGEVGVTGHWRWQPYGPQNSLLKRIFIKPYIRNYTNKYTEAHFV